MSDEKINRRQFFARAAVLGVTAVGAGSLLSACKKGADGGGSGGSKASADLSCTDTSGLKDQQVKVREALKYVDKSTEAGKRCDNCVLYKPAANDGDCGGCQSVPGPIHPAGHCTAWQAKT